jgi:hypothetical protein
VSVASSDGSASAAQDYSAVSTTVSFAAGDAVAKTISVPIADDDAAETDETLTLTLSAATGGASLGARRSATLTILDDDPPAAPAVAIGAAIKQLTFTWPGVPGATHYRLLRNPDGASGFAQIGPDHPAAATSATLDIDVHRQDWAKALYRLDACNAHGCSASSPASAGAAMLQSIGYFKASNTGPQDIFGAKIVLSTDGNTLAVAAPSEASNATGVNGNELDDSAPLAGAVYVFARNGAQWSQQAYVKASNTDAQDSFGISLALSADGNTLAVGAKGEDSGATSIDGDETDNSASASGAVYVFTRTAGHWAQQAYVKASNAEKDDEFGRAVALSADGNTLAAGAAGEDGSSTGVGGNETDNGLSVAGAVYVFTRTAAQWSQQAYVKASNTQAFDAFGFALALSGDGNTLAVNAANEASDATGIDGDQTDNDAPSSGAVYVFARTAGQWSQQAYVKASNTALADLFGSALTLSADGNTLAVGAPLEDSSARGIDGDQASNDNMQSGAAYVFTRAAGQWSQQAYVKASNTRTTDTFGSFLALTADGNTLAVSASNEDSSATGVNGDQLDTQTIDAGAVYVFARNGAQWSQQAYVKASNPGASDNFGTSVALSGDGGTLAVGASAEDGNATGVGGDQTNDDAILSGAVYIY